MIRQDLQVAKDRLTKTVTHAQFCGAQLHPDLWKHGSEGH